MLGFLNLDKPVGFTSHDCVAKVRHLLTMKRVGHGGTLDPLATGVLPIALGPATRLLPYLPTEKAYRALIRLGMNTTTDDLAGEIMATAPTSGLTLTDIEQALKAFQGHIQQRPPAYSAIHIQGQRCYDLARQGQPVPIQPRSVEIIEIQILDWRPVVGEYAELEVAITCGPGTYVRAIARDLGANLRTGGTLANLIRTRSCGFEGTQSLTFEALEMQLTQNEFKPLALEVTLPQSIVTLAADVAQRFCWGQKIPWPVEPSGNKGAGAMEIVQVHSQSQGFLGMGHLHNNMLLPKVVIQN